MNIEVDDEKQVDDLLSLFPEMAFGLGSVMFDQDCCVICKEEFSEGDLVLIVPECHHAFHGICLKQWWLSLAQNEKKCPICLQVVTSR